MGSRFVLFPFAYRISGHERETQTLRERDRREREKNKSESVNMLA